MRARRFLVAAGIALRKRPSIGWCPICVRRSVFAQIGENLREDVLCIRCRSSPRARAMLLALDRLSPSWRNLDVYEAGPSGRFSSYLAQECHRVTASFYLPSVPWGQSYDGMRSEDLENLTFDDASFDVVVTQDVLEHVLRPTVALAEIARVLRPNGLHLFTVPYSPQNPTAARAQPGQDGEILLLAPAHYHGDPLDPAGVLVITDWGLDLPDLVEEASGLRTEVLTLCDVAVGIPDPVTVFISRKLLD